MADQEIRTGRAGCALVVTADRVSNGPHLYYPNPTGPGGTGSHEDWVVDNFQHDPFPGCTMLDTAENVAARYKIDTGLQHALVLRRYEQYEAALANERAFQRRYMSLPFDVPDAKLRKTASTLAGDEGIRPVTAEGLARLKPVKPGGTVTFRRSNSPSRWQRGGCGNEPGARARAVAASGDRNPAGWLRAGQDGKGAYALRAG